MTELPTSPSQSVRRKNPGLFQGPVQGPLSVETWRPPHRPQPVSKPTTDEDRLNKTERAFLAVLRSRGHGPVLIQAVTLKVGDDCRYTPDFLLVINLGGLIAYEVKGFMRDDALVKLKTAARQFPWIDFVLVRRVKGEWIETPVNP